MLDAQLALEAYNERRERVLEHLNRELSEASRSLAREHSLTEHELRETELRARAAENLASVATLVAGLAHEIGTPMGVIRGHAEALESAVQGEKAQWRPAIRDQTTASRPSSIAVDIGAAPANGAAVDLAAVVDTAIAFPSEQLGGGSDAERDYGETHRARRSRQAAASS
jgi:signal transduction histidine kinase